MLRNIAVALAGRGCRLARALSAAASRSTLLRLVMGLPDLAASTPRVLGVDDFAIKRGQNMLVIVEMLISFDMYSVRPRHQSPAT